MTIRLHSHHWLDVLYNDVRNAPGGVKDAARFLSERRGKSIHYESLRAKLNGQEGEAMTFEMADLLTEWLTETRVRFATTWRLDNMVTGQSVQLELDYAAGTGATGYRPCGRPSLIFPSTTTGGVTVEHFRMVADVPFPAGQAARYIAMGNSITENSQNGPDFDLGWAYLLADQRAAKGAMDGVVIARGGQRSEHLAHCIPEMLALCDSNTIVVILIGTNDALQGTPQATTRANIQAIVDALRTKTKRISVACLPPLGSTPNAARALLVQDAIDMYYGADLLPPVRFDLALSLNNDGETRNTALYKENTHPNVAGNEVMRQRAILDLPELLE